MLLSDFYIVKKAPPHEGPNRVRVIVHIKENATGIIHTMETDEIFDLDEMRPSTFIWEEGNFACDCNRADFFGADDDSCGETRFSVNLQNPKTGEYYYKEF